MRYIKIALFVSLFMFVFGKGARAAELNTVKAADIVGLTENMPIPAVTDVTAENFFAEALAPENGMDPVIITVPGLRFNQIGPEFLEINTIVNIFHYFFPNNSRADVQRALQPELDKELREYLMLGKDEPIPQAETPQSRMPDNYLETAMRNLPGFSGRDIIIEPFSWSRDPDESKEYVLKLAKHIAAVYDKYKRTGRPICLISHSWGTMLAHTALHRLPETQNGVTVDRWITMGSPLMPGNLIVKLYDKLSVKKQDLEKRVSKPASVTGKWMNVWAKRDLISNYIKSADSNYQVDSQAQPYEDQVIYVFKHDASKRLQAQKDIFKLRSTSLWHESYQSDYDVYLKSLQRELSVKVLAPVVSPLVLGI